MANEFNFSRTPFENEKLPRLVFTVVAALVIGATLVHVFFLGRYLVREQQALDIQVAELSESLRETEDAIRRTRSDLARDQTELGNDRTSFLTRIYRHKNFSWTGLFNELEEITPADVRITSITPSTEDDEISVTLTLVGRTLKNVLEMVRALEGSSFFATVFPVDEIDLAESGLNETGIAATLRLQYVASEDEAGETAEPTPDPLPTDRSETSEIDGAASEQDPPRGASS